MFKDLETYYEKKFVGLFFQKRRYSFYTIYAVSGLLNRRVHKHLNKQIKLSLS